MTKTTNIAIDQPTAEHDGRKPRYEVQTEMLSGWENCWTTDAGEHNPNGTPVTYATREEAQQAIADHIADCINAVEAGDMIDSPDPTSLRVVEVMP